MGIHDFCLCLATTHIVILSRMLLNGLYLTLRLVSALCLTDRTHTL